MTNRERFHETMRFGKPDRVPYFEDGIRRDVLNAWRRQGLRWNQDLRTLFQVDRSYEIDIDYNPLAEVLHSPPSRRDLATLRTRFHSRPSLRFWRSWQKSVRSWRNQDDVLFLTVHPGFFLSMGVYDWNRFIEVISLLIDDQEFVQEAMLLQSRLIAGIVDEVLEDLEVDAVIFSEPIGGNEGPLISPAMYEEFVLKSYIPIQEVVKKHKIETVIVRTYANIRLLIPSLLKFGFDCLWACEIPKGVMNYREIRNEFGKRLRLIGGIDLDVLRQSTGEIRKEIEEQVLPLVAEGGFIPRADGRVRKDISFQQYLLYRQLLESILSGKNVAGE